MTVRKIKLKIKEKSTISRYASFKTSTKSSKGSILKSKKETINTYQNIYYADADAISGGFERDARRYSNLQEVTV